MRTDYKILREIIDGFSDPDAAPTSDGLAARRPRRPLGGEALDASVLEQDGPYRHDVRRTFERRSSTTDYAPEPLDAGPLLASVRAALVEDAETWGRDAAAVALEPFVLLLRPRGARPGVYRVRPDGADLVRDLPDPGEIEGMPAPEPSSRWPPTSTGPTRGPGPTVTATPWPAPPPSSTRCTCAAPPAV